MLSALEGYDMDDDDDFDGEPTMIPSDAEGFRAESDPGDQKLGRALRRQLHPSRGRRLLSKAAGPSFLGSTAIRGTIHKQPASGPPSQAQKRR